MKLLLVIVHLRQGFIYPWGIEGGVWSKILNYTPPIKIETTWSRLFGPFPAWNSLTAMIILYLKSEETLSSMMDPHPAPPSCGLGKWDPCMWDPTPQGVCLVDLGGTGSFPSQGGRLLCLLGGEHDLYWGGDLPLDKVCPWEKWMPGEKRWGSRSTFCAGCWRAAATMT